MGSRSTGENWLGNLPEDAGQSRTCPHFGEREPVANDEHLTLFKQSVDAWDDWRTQNRSIIPDLSGLAGVHLCKFDLIPRQALFGSGQQPPDGLWSIAFGSERLSFNPFS
jgi:hypothetical protein